MTYAGWLHADADYSGGVCPECVVLNYLILLI